MLNSIINPECSSQPQSMQLDKLQTAFDRLYGGTSCGGRRRFRDLAGLQMKKFIEKHPNRYDLVRKKSKLYVKLKNEKIQMHGHSEAVIPHMDQFYVKEQLPRDRISTSEDEYSRSEPENIESNEHIVQIDSNQSEIEDQNWTTVKSSKKCSIMKNSTDADSNSPIHKMEETQQITCRWKK